MAVPKKPGAKVRAKPADGKPPAAIPPPVIPLPQMRKDHPAPPKPEAAPAVLRPAASPAPVISEEAIRAKAHALWKARGCRHGCADQDWADAVAFLKAEAAKKAQPKPAAPAAEPALKLVRVA